MRAEAAAEMKALREALVGQQPMMGYEGILARKLVIDWQTWTTPLFELRRDGSEHPLADAMEEMLTCWGELFELMWATFDKEHRKVQDVSSYIERLKKVVSDHFTGKADGCACHPTVFSPVYQGDPKTGPTKEEKKTQYRRTVAGGATHPFHPFKNGLYQHTAYQHIRDLCIDYGGPMRFSSIVLEAANKVWKHLIIYHTCPGASADAQRAWQALQRFSQMTHPEMQKRFKKHEAGVRSVREKKRKARRATV
jgi:hypothetical protein